MNLDELPDPFADKRVRHDIRGGLWGVSLSVTALELEPDPAERLLLVDGIIETAQQCDELLASFYRRHGVDPSAFESPL